MSLKTKGSARMVIALLVAFIMVCGLAVSSLAENVTTPTDLQPVPEDAWKAYVYVRNSASPSDYSWLGEMTLTPAEDGSKALDIAALRALLTEKGMTAKLSGATYRYGIGKSLREAQWLGDVSAEERGALVLFQQAPVETGLFVMVVPVFAAEPTAEPVATEDPNATEEPATTDDPTVTEAPATTEEPATTDAPATTDDPTATEVPATTEEPATTNDPATTDDPTATEVPATTEVPTATEVPAATEKPALTTEPTAEPTATVEPTAEPTPTTEPTAEPTATVEPTAEPTPTTEPTAEPTATVEPMAEPTPTTEPTAEPTATVEPTAEPTATVEPTAEPTAEPTPVPLTYTVQVAFANQQDYYCYGETLTLISTIKVTEGELTPVYQWQVQTAPGEAWVNIEGAVAPEYSFVLDEATSTYRYRVVVLNQDATEGV